MRSKSTRLSRRRSNANALRLQRHARRTTSRASFARSQRLRSNNMLERLNEEIRRRERVIRVFPSDASALRMIGALLAETSEEWQSRVYLAMDEYHEWRAAHHTPSIAIAQNDS